MTDEQIMQGLKWCYQVEGSCGDCPYRPDDIKKAKCHDRLGNDVIGLIERQQAEIERLKMLFNDQQEIIADLEWTVENEGFKHLGKMYSELRSEAIKEFAEKAISICEELEKEYSHICKSKKEAREETCRYEGALNVKIRLKAYAKEMGCGE